MLREERKTGLIPRVYLERAMGPQVHAVLMTDVRAIFVYEDSMAPIFGHALGGVVGHSIAAAVWKPKMYDYERIYPEALAQDPKNTVVFHESLESIELRRHLGGLYRFHLRYRDAHGSTQRLLVTLAPPKEYLQAQRSQGVKAGMAFGTYIKDAQELYRQSLPGGLPIRVQWRD